MGYGLAGAIGVSTANPSRRVFHVEGDGGFAQNMQELGTVSIRKLNIKSFIFANQGYASIRMTQRNYFDGAWIGCDSSTGVGLPDWEKLFASFEIRCRTIGPEELQSLSTDEWLQDDEPAGFVLRIDPEQTYYPKISSRITQNGSMESNPLHSMTPELDLELMRRVAPHLAHLTGA